MTAYGMLYAVAVGLPIVLAALVVSALVRRQGRPERGWWLAALGLVLLLPIVGLSSPAAEAPVAPAPVVETGWIGLPTVVMVSAAPVVSVGVAPSGISLDEILVVLWLMASLLLGVRWVVAAVRLGALTDASPPATLDGVPVRLTENVGPAVSGVLDPRILVPSWLASMPHEQRSLVLLHEEEHVRARDPILLALSRVARVLVPWNPWVWLLSSRLRRGVELDCDRRVLRRHPDVEAYGSTLLTVSSHYSDAFVGAAAFAESEAPLRTRILAMTTPPRTVSILSVLTALVLGVGLLAGVFEVPIPSMSGRVELGTESDGAPTGRVSAVVADENSDVPLQNVQVFLRGTGMGGLSDNEGRILLSNVPVGSYELVAHLIGHDQVAQTIVVRADEVSALDLHLVQVAVPVNGVIVTDPTAGDSRPSDALLVYVDGVRMDRPTGSLDEYLGRLAASSTVEGIEIIDGGAARAQYGDEASGGVVHITLAHGSNETPPSVVTGSPDRPTFTPFSVAPRIRNVEEVRAAIAEAYPEELRTEGVGGTVEVYFFLDEEGEVRDVRISQSSGHPALDDAALAVAQVYRFSPALNRDQPVAVWVRFPISFLRTS